MPLSKIQLSSSTGRRNLIINGAMQVAQRGTSGTATGDSYYPSIDRFKWRSYGGAGRASFEQSTDTPNGDFRYSLKATVTTVHSTLDASDSAISQVIEGYNRLPLGWGTSTASSCTVSFWVKTSIAGIYSVSMRVGSGGRSQVQETPSLTANTWTKVALTFVGDTDGTWLTSNYATNGSGLLLEFNLGRSNAKNTTTFGSWIGSNRVSSDNQVRWIATSGATFYLTGVQMEKGSSASDFEHRPFGEEFALCERYFEKSYSHGTSPGTNTSGGLITTDSMGGDTTTAYLAHQLRYRTAKRANPTVTIYDQDETSGKVTSHATGVGTSHNQSISTEHASDKSISVNRTSGTAANGFRYHYTADAEM